MAREPERRGSRPVQDVIEAVFERLVAANIELLPLPEMQTHFVFTRDGFVALVERKESGFGSIGAAGILAERGLAPLVWRAGEAYFVARGFEQKATAEQVAAARKFADDLAAALAC